MMASSGGVIHIRWYGTFMRGDKLEDALKEIAPVALHYGATGYEVFRSREDRYSFLQTATFENAVDFERYWYGPEFSDFRAKCSSWYQVPVAYVWHDLVAGEAVSFAS